MVAYQLLKQALLVAEVEIDRALGDAGTPRHIVEARRLESSARKFIERGSKNRLAAIRATGLARCACRDSLPRGPPPPHACGGLPCARLIFGISLASTSLHQL